MDNLFLPEPLAPPSKLMRKDYFIDRLQQSGANLPMNLRRNVDDRLPHLVFRHSSHPLGALGVSARANNSLRKKAPENALRATIVSLHIIHLALAASETSTHKFC